MNHPLFGNRKLIIIYFTVWIAISAIHIFLLNNIYSIQTDVAITDSLVFNSVFALFGIPVWYVVAYSKKGKYSQINQFINHITSAAIILFIWISACSSILKITFPETSYKPYIDSTITWRVISGLFFYSILTMFYYVIMYYKEMEEHSLRESKLNDIVKQAALDNLRSQINPHFLFNSLNSISSLTITSPEKAQEMIIKLSDFLRYSISQSSENFSMLQTELNNIRLYIDIEQVRFGNKLVHEFEIGKECMSKEVPAMILQPLYENAVKHGVYESTEPIKIFTNCEMDGNFLQLTISNNFDPEARSKKGAGIGLKNIKERLRLIYGSSELLKTKVEGNNFIAELTIPQKEN